MVESIENIEVRVESVRLVKPYVLSFATLHEFEAVRVCFHVGNERLTGEVVPLPGYADETTGMVTSFVQEIREALIGKSLDEAREIVVSHNDYTPFQGTALLSAIDSATWKVDSSETLSQIPTVVPIAADQQAFDRAEAIARKNGWDIKIKVGTDFQRDLEFVTTLRVSPEFDDTRIRLDANQAYTFEQTQKILETLSDSPWAFRVDYLEQPVHRSNWADFERLVKLRTRVPIMLDEPIETDEDVRRAADIGVKFVKLKLFKQGGIVETERQARLAQSLGMSVVIGNGVATWESNRHELQLYKTNPGVFYGACEANGFRKCAMNQITHSN